MASAASSTVATAKRPVLVGSMSWIPVSWITTGRPAARKHADRSLNQPDLPPTYSPLAQLNSPAELATYSKYDSGVEATASADSSRHPFSASSPTSSSPDPL